MLPDLLLCAWHPLARFTGEQVCESSAISADRPDQVANAVGLVDTEAELYVAHYSPSCFAGAAAAGTSLARRLSYILAVSHISSVHVSQERDPRQP
jgi:hypothetical protein